MVFMTRSCLAAHVCMCLGLVIEQQELYLFPQVLQSVHPVDLLTHFQEKKFSI